MKKIISFALALCLLVPLGICGAFADDGSSWELTYFVDDFGDPTDDAYLRCITTGTFSNTATTGSNLRVIVSLELGGYNESILALRLLEYEDVKATYFDSDDKAIKVKIGDEITESTLMGTSPNGDLMCSGGQFLMTLYEALVNNEQEVRFVVEVGSSKYSFSINGSGFSEALAEYYTVYPQRSRWPYYQNTEFVMLENVFGYNAGKFVFKEKSYSVGYEKIDIDGVGAMYLYDFYPDNGHLDIGFDDLPGKVYEQYLCDSGFEVETEYPSRKEIQNIVSSSENALNHVNDLIGGNRFYIDSFGNKLIILESTFNTSASKSHSCILVLDT